MAVGTFAVLYNHTTGEIHNMWLRTASDNIATWQADQKITIDGVDVADGWDAAEVAAETGADMRVALVTDPTDADVAAPTGVFTGTITTDVLTDVNERTDSDRNGGDDGTDDGQYDFDNPPV